jgi:hypothetical protein
MPAFRRQIRRRLTSSNRPALPDSMSTKTTGGNDDQITTAVSAGQPAEALVPLEEAPSVFFSTCVAEEQQAATPEMFRFIATQYEI